ncbi:MAG: hypothetical protein KR126chlam1_00753 [Chlamydiae bacterium]|nr:hypothetical protein [Chlamydiota bacterium]
MKKFITIIFSLLALAVPALYSHTFIDPDQGPLFELPKTHLANEGSLPEAEESLDNDAEEDSQGWGDWLNYVDEDEDQDEGVADIAEDIAPLDEDEVAKETPEDLMEQEEPKVAVQSSSIFVDAHTGITFAIPEEFKLVEFGERGFFRGDWSSVFQNKNGETLSITFYDLVVRYPWKGYACSGSYFGIPLERFFNEMEEERRGEAKMDKVGQLECLKYHSEEEGLAGYFLHREYAVGVSLSFSDKKKLDDLQSKLEQVLASVKFQAIK